MKKFLLVFSQILFVLSYVGIAITHIYCCYIAYMIGPFWKVILTFFFPIISEIYWIVYLWNYSGSIPIIGILIFCLIGIYLLALFLTFIGDSDKIYNKTIKEKKKCIYKQKINFAKEKSIKIKFLKFFLYIFLPIRFLALIINFLSDFYILDEGWLYFLGLLQYSEVWLPLLVYVFDGLLLIVLWFCLRKFSKKFIPILWFYIIFDIVLYIITSYMYENYTSLFISITIDILILVYFNKRKTLFNSDTDFSSVDIFNNTYQTNTYNSLIHSDAEVRQNDHQKPQFCRKCGQRLNADSIFCNNCGTRIETIE